MECSLIEAVKTNNESEVTRLIEAGVDVNETDDHGKTAVFYANRNKSMGVLCELIECGAEFELDEIDGKSVLFYAARNDVTEVVSELRDSGLDLDITDDEGKTAVFYANRNKKMGVLCKLFEYGAEFKLDEIDGKAALFYAAEKGLTEIVRKLHSADLDLNITDGEGRTALLYANRCKKMGVLCELIKCGAKFELDEIDGKTALFYAARMDIIEVVRELHDAGLDLNITDDEGRTPLFYATEKEVIDLLIDEYKLFINARDQCGRTPLFHAVKQGYTLDTVQHLIEKGGNIQLKDNCNVSVFSLLVRNSIRSMWSLEDVVSKLLLEKREQKSLAFAIFDIIYCQAPLLTLGILKILFSEPHVIFNQQGVLNALTFVTHQDFIEESDKSKINKIIKRLKSEGKINVPSILDLLNKLGANPNAVDVDGNTALHHATTLLCFGVEQETVMDICTKLRDLGSRFKLKNHDDETPLLYSLSSNSNHVFYLNRVKFKVLYPQQENNFPQLCRFLLTNGSDVNETSQRDGSVFHLVMKLVKENLKVCPEGSKRFALYESIELLELFSSLKGEKRMKNIVNISDENLNTPLHLWASLTLPSPQDYTSPITKHHTFAEILKVMLKIFRKCGAILCLRNENKETPLHRCKTWSAVKLLIDYGANPKDLDSSKSSPLLAIDKTTTYVQNLDRFYPDVTEDPKTFWKSVIEKGLDPWTKNKQGESVLGVLIKLETFSLAKALVEVTCEMNPASGTKLALLHIICKDESKRLHWKTKLVEMILKSTGNERISVDSPLRLCCENIVKFGMYEDTPKEKSDCLQQTINMKATSNVEETPSERSRMEDENPEINDSVHCKIAKQLLFYKDDNTVPQSCLDIARENPALKQLLTTPIDINSIPSLIPWTSVSDQYKEVLEKVSRQKERKIVDDQIWHHTRNIGKGSFGVIFPGINEKDGREVAVKRIDTLRLPGLAQQQESDYRREIENLVTLADCQQVVRYVNFIEEGEFSYIVLELMEGDLDDYLTRFPYGYRKRYDTQLCQDVVMGLKYLHHSKILHRDLKPGNILYKVHPQLCLKIADFGLSGRIHASGSVSHLGTRFGTRCWIAPEVFRSPENYSKSSDMFSCGLVLHYILMGQKHPFNPPDCGSKSELKITNDTENNIRQDRMEGWGDSLHPEAAHLIKRMLNNNDQHRPTAEEATEHPMFWTNEKKGGFLVAVSNNDISTLSTDLQKSFPVIVKHGSWNDKRYPKFETLYQKLDATRFKPGDPKSVVALIRFIRNAYAHASENKLYSGVQEMFFVNYEYLNVYFPNLIMEVYKVITSHGWDVSKLEIKSIIKRK